MRRHYDDVAQGIDLHRVVIGDSGQLARKAVEPTPERAVSVVAIRTKTDEGIPAAVIAGMAPDHAARRIPGGPPAGVQDRRWMLRTMPPGQRVQVEKMRYGDCLDLRPQLRPGL